MSEPVGVGLIGMGSIGQRHVEAIGALGGEARLVAASGGTATALADAGQTGARHCSPEEVLAHPDVEIVVLCTPSGLHGEQALAALRMDKHVVVEKPLSVDVASAEEIVRVAAERSRFVSVISQRRLEPQNQYLKRLLEDGSLGRPILGETFCHWYRDDEYYSHAGWRTEQHSGGGSLINQGLHSVDLLAWLLGPVASVTAQYATLGREMDAEDTTVATLRFSSGALGLVGTTTATPPGRPAALTLFTSTGSLEFANNDVVRWDLPGVPEPTDEAAHTADAAGSGASDPRAIGLAGHLTQWRDIITAYRTGRQPAVSAQDGLDTVRLICGIYQAAETGQEVTMGGGR